MWHLLSLPLQNMTYARQLQMYEEAVIEKRLEEMTEAELEQLMVEVEAEKQQGVGRLLMRKAEERQQQQQQQQQQ
jgi:ribosomal protein S18 acetylase RimI-like enzyme